MAKESSSISSGHTPERSNLTCRQPGSSGTAGTRSPKLEPARPHSEPIRFASESELLLIFLFGCHPDHRATTHTRTCSCRPTGSPSTCTIPTSASSSRTKTRCSTRAGHLPGAVHVDWTHDLNDQVRRDYVGRDAFNALMSRIGVTRDTKVVFYGDRNNWWACYAFWVFQLFGHANAAGHGRRPREMGEGESSADARCAALRGHPLRGAGAQGRGYPGLPGGGARARAEARPAGRRAQPRGISPARACTCRSIRTRARCAAVTSPAQRASRGRAPSIQMTAPSRAPRNCARCTWSRTAWRRLHDTIAYCRIGERSSHTWFALKYLLGFENVRNYDGSWTEWGNIWWGVPIEKIRRAEPQTLSSYHDPPPAEAPRHVRDVSRTPRTGRICF